MNRKVLLIFGGLLGVIVIIALVVYLFKGNSSSPKVDKNSLQAVFDANSQSEIPQADKISIPTKSGGTILINNVFKKASRSTDSRYQDYKISDEVTYTAGGGGETFIIRVVGTNSDLLAAEKRFLNLLGITQSDGCNLDIQEYLGARGKDSLFVRDTLSFCENLQ